MFLIVQTLRHSFQINGSHAQVPARRHYSVSQACVVWSRANDKFITRNETGGNRTTVVSTNDNKFSTHFIALHLYQ